MATAVKARGAGAGRLVAPALALRARRAATVAAGAGLIVIALAVAVALIGYDARDPSFDTVTGAAARNWLGAPGAWVADALLALVGWAAAALLPATIVAGVRLLRGAGLAKWRRYALATLLGTLALAAAIGVALPDPLAALPAGTGGAVGLVAATLGDALDSSALLDAVPLAGLAAGTLFVVGLALLAWGSGLDRGDASALASLFRPRDEEAEVAAGPRRAVRDTLVRDDPPSPAVQLAAAPRATIVAPATAATPSARRGRRERQPTLGLGDIYELPPLDLLKPAPKGPVAKIDRAALEQNARLLESVLEDFGVRGRIGDVRPGPVVTMYELEPAPGLKASRVIGLSDDIARSMSAVSARVAVVPGRNVIGIELPNANRQMVTLAELLASASFDDQSAALPLVLGKNIAGDPVIADLSPMPHLLIAGTTGSGKSVGLNCMILSLLYRLSPQQCRMIMIDPKMLELSVYDRIPHLLSPVVTEPAKAIRALKWAVEQMEDRYRMMSTINVRSLSGFNQRVREAKASAKPFVRKVHTGYDDDGVAIYEEETLDFETLPLIVVVVDELADLMMTAGKEVEFLIQRRLGSASR
jgi:S-DNA-T family DNA segregation ATPase FtsK/SpoIIIE